MTTEIDRTQFYSGGFFLIRSAKQEQDAELLPEKIISLSPCYCDRYDDWYGRVSQFEIPESRKEELTSWWKAGIQAGTADIFGLFLSAQTARQFIHQFISDTTDLYLIEIGLPVYFFEEGLRESLAEERNTGINKRLYQKNSISSDGEILGFEVVGSEPYGFSCSWLCSHIHRDMYELYGTRPNAYGLIDDFDDARKVYEWIAEDEMKGTRAEPIPYDFWLLVSHPLEAENPA